MAISSSIRCGLPCSANPEEEQSTCSLLTRSAAAGLGGIVLLVGALALSGIPELNGLGTIGSALFITMGTVVLLTSVCLRSVKESTIEERTPLQTIKKPCAIKYRDSSLNPTALKSTSKIEELDDSASFENLKAGEIGPIREVDGIYMAVARAPTGEKMYFAMEALGNDRHKWSKYKVAAKLLVEGNDFGGTIGSLTELGSHVNKGGKLEDFTASLDFPNFWTCDKARSEKLVADLIKQKIVTDSSKAKELSTIPHASHGVNLQEQTHMVYSSKSPIIGRFKTPPAGKMTDYLFTHGFGAYVDCFGDLLMSVGVNIMENHQLVENRGVFTNLLRVIEGGYGGISMMHHSFTCMVVLHYYSSINKFLVRPLKRMGEIYVNSIPKELLPQITINGIPGDQYTGGFECEKPVLAPIEILADLHRARPKSL